MLLQMVPAGVVGSHTAAHNTAPFIDPIADQTVDEDVTLHLEITGDDADGDNVIFEVENLPAGATFQQNSTQPAPKAYLKWTPSFEQAGDYTVTVKLRDEYTAATQDFNITVNNINRAPTMDFIHNKFIDELEEFDMQWSGSDPDGDTVVMTLESNVTDVGALPLGVDFSDGGDGNAAMAWTPDCTQGDDDPTIYHFWANITDSNGASFTREFDIQVFNVNAPPIVTAIDPKLAVEGDLLSFTINATSCDDFEDHFLDVGLVSAVLSGITPPPIPATPPANWTLPVGVTVEPEDQTPTNATENPMLFDSVDEEYYSYFNWTIGYQQAGNYTFYAQVVDDVGNQNNITFEIRITDFNTAPVLILQPAQVDCPLMPFAHYCAAEEREFGNHTVLNLDGTTTILENWTALALDLQNDTVFWEIDWLDVPGVQLPDGMNVTTPDPPVNANVSFLQINWKPTYEQAGNYSFRIAVTDGAIDVELLFSICVENTNRPPYIEPIPDFIIFEQEEIIVEVEGHEHDFRDPDFPDDVELTATGLPPGSQFQDGHVEDTIFFNGTFIWTPGYHQAGVYTINISADDSDLDDACPLHDLPGPPLEPGHGHDNQTFREFNITVLNVDRPPVIYPALEDQTWLIGTTITVDIESSDPDGDLITLSAAPLPAGAILTDNTDGTGDITWTPGPGTSGVYDILVSACSGLPVLCDTDTVRITVVEATDYEVTPTVGPIVTGSPGTPVTLTADVENTAPAGTDTISFSVSATGGATATTPAAVVVTAGAGPTAISFDVTIPATDSEFFVTLTATSALDPALVKDTHWRIDVPIVLNVTMTNTLPVLPISGIVEAFYLDGAPAVGVGIEVEQSPDDVPNPAGIFTSAVTGATGSGGTWSFSFGADAGSKLPGAHTLVVTSDYFGRADTLVDSYSVP